MPNLEKEILNKKLIKEDQSVKHRVIWWEKMYSLKIFITTQQTINIKFKLNIFTLGSLIILHKEEKLINKTDSCNQSKDLSGIIHKSKQKHHWIRNRRRQ